MKALFGTDGIRGEAGQFPLDPATVSAIGFSLASHLAKDACERRKSSSDETRANPANGSSRRSSTARPEPAQNVSPQVLSQLPASRYLTRKLQASAGVVISASHNPYQDNGIKIFAPSGQKMDDSVERLIEADVFANADQPPASEHESAHPFHQSSKRYFGRNI